MSNKFPCKIEIPIKNDVELVMLYSLLSTSSFEDVLRGAKASFISHVKNYIPIFKANTIEVDDFIDSVFDIIASKYDRIIAASNRYNSKIKDVSKKSQKDNNHSHITKIHTEVVEKNGEKYVNIVRFENVKSLNELPNSYELGFPKYYKTRLAYPALNKLIVCISDTRKVVFEIGDVIEKTKFEEYIEIMKQAGERLVHCNKSIKEDKRIQQIRKDVKERAEELYNSNNDKIHEKNNHIYTI